MATRIVQRKTPKYKTQCEKNPDAQTGLCGNCIGPPGAKIMHDICLGLTHRTLTCTCQVCYGPSEANTNVRRKR